MQIKSALFLLIAMNSVTDLFVFFPWMLLLLKMALSVCTNVVVWCAYFVGSFQRDGHWFFFQTNEGLPYYFFSKVRHWFTLSIQMQINKKWNRIKVNVFQKCSCVQITSAIGSLFLVQISITLLHVQVPCSHFNTKIYILSTSLHLFVCWNLLTFVLKSFV